MLAIKKKICVILYIATLYYLLPFRPLYLYYTSESRANEVASKLRNNGAITAKEGFGKLEVVKSHHDNFPKKKKVKFFFYSLKIEDPLELQNAYLQVPKLIALVKNQYLNFNLLVKHTRGPPTA